MKKLFFLIFLIMLSINLFGFTVVLDNNKSLTGEYVDETQDNIIMKLENKLYNISIDIISFYVYNDRKIPVGKTKEILNLKKVKYNKILAVINITDKNYEQFTQNWQDYVKTSYYSSHVIQKGNRVFLSYVFTLNHLKSHESLNASNGGAVSFERLIKRKKNKIGFGLGTSLIPYRVIDRVGQAAEYSFLPIYALCYIPIENKSFYSDFTIRNGVDFFFANKTYRGSSNDTFAVYLSASYLVKISDFVIGFGYQINTGRFTKYNDLVFVKDSSFFISIGIM